ncbi:phosphatase PAP2 family protein [Lysobacter pythonis]|uniref:undecaprenyl-diphosphate phosphatase n=1 Tax=Solilutibacter pythonis TaxID=2483112 RepID=A0A3M2HXK7_9GAMM|nr:phosphatase PAP2 family protein [Lysobacter pythonis]RMH94461.1 phosphatase PAP2 family protein [Lysobacter pythonis]
MRALPESPDTLRPRANAATRGRRRRFTRREGHWCRRANGLGAFRGSRAYFATISRLGDGLFWYALIGAMIVIDGLRGLQVSAHLAVVGAVSLLLYKALKRWTRRPRPFAADRHIRAWVAPLDEFSFPSGHTLHAVAFTIVALAYYPALAWLLIPFTASVALSRVVLGLHYPSDVLAATGIGVLLAGLSLWLAPGAY